VTPSGRFLVRTCHYSILEPGMQIIVQKVTKRIRALRGTVGAPYCVTVAATRAVTYPKPDRLVRSGASVTLRHFKVLTEMVRPPMLQP